MMLNSPFKLKLQEERTRIHEQELWNEHCILLTQPNVEKRYHGHGASLIQE